MRTRSRCSSVTPRAATIPTLKDWAGKTLPALKHHLDMAKELGKAPSVGQTK